MSVPLRNPSRLVQGDQQVLRQFIRDLESSKDRPFSSGTYLQGHNRINGTWYRWIYTSQIQLQSGITGYINSGDKKTAPSTLQCNAIFGKISEI